MYLCTHLDVGKWINVCGYSTLDASLNAICAGYSVTENHLSNSQIFWIEETISSNSKLYLNMIKYDLAMGKCVESQGSEISQELGGIMASCLHCETGSGWWARTGNYSESRHLVSVSLIRVVGAGRLRRGHGADRSVTGFRWIEVRPTHIRRVGVRGGSGTDPTARIDTSVVL